MDPKREGEYKMAFEAMVTFIGVLEKRRKGVNYQMPLHNIEKYISHDLQFD